jgi:hypothetical protein
MSYSQSADSGLAPALQKALHRFAKPWYRMRVLHIFRDRTSLAVTPELWGSIENALSQSRHFLLCASPEAAESRWVQDEIAWWLKNRENDKMFILLTGGEILWDEASGDFDWGKTTALPRTLSGVFSTEPLYVDLKFARGAEDLSLRNTSFREAVLALAAPLHNRPKDELGGADVREHRKTLQIAAAAVAALAILFIGQEIAAFTVHGGSVWSVSFSPDGKFIATGSEDGNAHIYECTVCASDEDLMTSARARLLNVSPPLKAEEP